MTLDDAKTYVAFPVGGGNSDALKLQAGLAIRAAAGIWNRVRWSFLRKRVDIPVAQDVATVNLPSDYLRPYTARLQTKQQPLRYIQRRQWDHCVTNQSLSGWPWFYTVEPLDSWTPAAPLMRIVLLRTPDAADTLTFTYYRRIDGTAGTIDVPEDYLMDFLDTARVMLIQGKNAADERLPLLKADIQVRLAKAVADDQEESEDEQLGFVAPNWGVGGVGWGVVPGDENFPGGFPTA